MTVAHIIGGLTTSHIPAIGNAVPNEEVLKNDPYWQPFFSGYGKAREWLQAAKPDVAIVIYNDHGLNFFLDKLPTFSIGAAFEYQHADEGWRRSADPDHHMRQRFKRLKRLQKPEKPESDGQQDLGRPQAGI